MALGIDASVIKRLAKPEPVEATEAPPIVVERLPGLDNSVFTRIPQRHTQVADAEPTAKLPGLDTSIFARIGKAPEPVAAPAVVAEVPKPARLPPLPVEKPEAKPEVVALPSVDTEVFAKLIEADTAPEITPAPPLPVLPAPEPVKVDPMLEMLGEFRKLYAEMSKPKKYRIKRDGDGRMTEIEMG